MDFGALLHYAKKNSDAAIKEQGKYYSTKYAPPKKESKESKQLSSNIQKFLKKREAEELERKQQEREKVNNLLAMRDEKSKTKIRKMLKVTKSANKSVLEDAKDCDNVGMGAADQTEGDDYGYVSTEANAFYLKYIEKVKDVKEDKGFAPSRPSSVRDLSGTKERVKAAITREREESKSNARQRTSATRTEKDLHLDRVCKTSDKKLYNTEAGKRDEEHKKPDEQKKPKVKRPAQPPPMDFQSLLRLAEKKQHEPVNIVVPEKKAPERLLSAREKREQEEHQRWKEQRAQRERMRETEANKLANGKDSRKDNGQPGQSSRLPSDGRIPKLTKSTTAGSETKAKLPTGDSLKRSASSAPSNSRAKISTISRTATGKNEAVNGTSNGILKRPASCLTNGAKSAAGGGGVVGGGGAVGGGGVVGGGGAAASKSSSSTVQSRNPYTGIVKSGATREFPPREPPSKIRKPAAGGETRGRDPSAAGRKPVETGNKRRIYYDDDDDSEYDSELDDFIDDGDCNEDISSHIRDIFGYDRRRYRDLDEDDDQMESSFAQVQREEFISKKLGLQEDLEDMRMEALHKKQKMAKKRSSRIDD